MARVKKKCTATLVAQKKKKKASPNMLRWASLGRYNEPSHFDYCITPAIQAISVNEMSSFLKEFNSRMRQHHESVGDCF